MVYALDQEFDFADALKALQKKGKKYIKIYKSQKKSRQGVSEWLMATVHYQAI